MIDYAASKHTTAQELAALELRVAARYATREELRQAEEKANEAVTLAGKIEARLGGIEASVNNMSGNITRLFWSVIGSVFAAFIARAMGWL